MNCCNKDRTYYEGLAHESPEPWGLQDEKYWERGFVYCELCEYDNESASVNDIPPKDCRYKLEHILKSDKLSNKKEINNVD
jgi:hypothetical protein